MSQSAFSQTVGSLERRLEVRLLVRARGGVHPTEIGRALLDEARAVLDRHERARSTLARKLGARDEVLRLGMVAGLPPELLVKPISALATAYPCTRVTVRHLPQATQESALRAAALDVGLLHGRPGGDDLDCLLVLEEPP